VPRSVARHGSRSIKAQEAACGMTATATPHTVTTGKDTMELALHFDLRAPEIGPSVDELYRTAIEQCAWAEKRGFDLAILSCHHGCDDDYGSSQIVTAAGIASRTSTMRLQPIVSLPLYHPLHVAEDLAVLDIISGGRAQVLLGAGYRPSEFRMFGVPMHRRGRLMDEGVRALQQAWTGEPFEFRGEQVMVRPRPLQRPGPPITIGGDSVAAARRAARLGVDYYPIPGSTTYADYRAACAEFGRSVPDQPRVPTWMFLQVSEDPDATAAKIEPHLLHVTNSYARWLAADNRTAVYETATDVAALRAGGNFRIVTPEACIELAKDYDLLMLDTLFGGIPIDIAWDSLELFVDKVLPAIKPAAVPPPVSEAAV
jgi:alkanesulfonate monooxygenase SsuD/methylene tetrahydromethanopterin reductase-like flavin-dependent oxidoreductase (luciferase family)